MERTTLEGNEQVEVTKLQDEIGALCAWCKLRFMNTTHPMLWPCGQSRPLVTVARFWI